MQKLHIQFDVRDASNSAAFYKALLGASPVLQTATAATFETSSPPLRLVVEQRRHGSGHLSRRPPLPHSAKQRPGEASANGDRFTLIVNEPRHVGDAAIALRGAGVRLTLEDSGLAARDPDDNLWLVRFDPTAKERLIIPADGGRPR